MDRTDVDLIVELGRRAQEAEDKEQQLRVILRKLRDLAEHTIEHDLEFGAYEVLDIIDRDPETPQE
jgi:hypothetical protein